MGRASTRSRARGVTPAFSTPSTAPFPDTSGAIIRTHIARILPPVLAMLDSKTGQYRVTMVERSEKHEKFRALAANRTDKALEAIERIGNLSNRQLYEWDEAEVRKIIKALRDEVTKIEVRFSAPNSRRRNRFSL